MHEREVSGAVAADERRILALRGHAQRDERRFVPAATQLEGKMVHVLSDTAQMEIVERGDQRYPHAPTRFRRNALRLIQDPGGGRMVNLPEGEETRSPRVGTIGRPGAPHTSYPEPGACALRSSSRRRRLADAPLGRA